MSEQTTLWKSLSITPSEYLKDFNKGFKGKSIDPTYRIMLFNKVFGDIGDMWEPVTEDRWISDINGTFVAFVTMHIKYRKESGGEWFRTGSHTGGTVCDRNLDEVYKCSETDAFGKAALDLGLAADVYLGQHDGDKYQLPSASTPVYAPQPTQAPHEAPVAVAPSQNGWRSAVVPIPGKNKGKTLGSLSRKSLEWYIENIKANPKFEDSVAFRKALDEAGRELNA